MSVLQAMVSNGADQRRADDFYPTPPEATIALLPLIAHWPRECWEPACGDGAIAEVLERAGFVVAATDLIDRGYGLTSVDFLEPGSHNWPSAACRKVGITNPPFKLAAEFIRRANQIGMTHLALLLKSNFWNAAKRLALWDEWPPYARHDLTWRLDFTGAGSPHTDCSWFLWDRTSPPMPRPLPKPAPISPSREEMLA